MDEKMMKKLGIVIAGFIVFILILFLLASCSNKKYTYEKLENQMMRIAKEYFKNNEKELPSQDKDTRSYTLKKMISDGKLAEVTELFNDENMKCDGNVTVKNNNGNYLYIPYLSCGKDYTTTYLKDKILENVVENGVGLHEVGDEYIFKGEVDNNYLSFNGLNYRIMKINDDGSIRVIQLDGIKRVQWDDRYTDETKRNNGINEFINNGINSRLKDSIDSYYNSDIWDNGYRAYIPTQTICIGKRSEADITTDGSTECSKKLENQTFTAIAVYEVFQSTLSESCTGINDKNCLNYNWFDDIKDSLITITADVETIQYAYFYEYGGFNKELCKVKGALNVVFNIDDKVVYEGGDGTIENPYTFKTEVEAK